MRAFVQFTPASLSIALSFEASIFQLEMPLFSVTKANASSYLKQIVLQKH
jgi:hypothetical protein